MSSAELAYADRNDTCQNDENYPLRQVIIMGCVLPPLLAFGIVASILNILVFSHKVMRVSSINWYLLCLSSSDLVSFICAIFLFSLPVLGEWFTSICLHELAVKSTQALYPMGLIAQTASVYLTVLVSGHRFIGVTVPFKAHLICKRRNVKIAIVSVFVFALAYNISRFFELSTNSCFSPQYNGTITNLAPTELRMNGNYIFGYLGWSYTVVMLVIPFILLIGMNIRVVMAVQETRKRHAHCDYQDPRAKMEAAKERSTTIMLIGIVVVFLLCNTLAFVSNMLEMVMREFGEVIDEGVTTSYQVIVNISNLMVLLGSSVNIFIYLSFSDKYRALLLYFLCYFTSGKRKDYLMDTLNNAINS